MEILPDIFTRNVPQIVLIAESFQRLTGVPLLADGSCRPNQLWAAPLAIVAHGREDDPVFFFGNRVALELFQMDAERFIATSSRLSAEEGLREERAELIARVFRDGYMADYSGIRISAHGRRFRIHRATVWNIVDGADSLHGQAAAFSEWTFLK